MPAVEAGNLTETIARGVRRKAKCLYTPRRHRRREGPEESPAVGREKLDAGDRSGLKLAELLPVLSQALQLEIQSGRLSPSMTSRGLTISFTEAALFPSGEDEIAPGFCPTIHFYPTIHFLSHYPFFIPLSVFYPTIQKIADALAISKQLGALGRARHRAGATLHQVRRFAQTAFYGRLRRHRAHR